MADDSKYTQFEPPQLTFWQVVATRAIKAFIGTAFLVGCVMGMVSASQHLTGRLYLVGEATLFAFCFVWWVLP